MAYAEGRGGCWAGLHSHEDQAEAKADMLFWISRLSVSLQTSLNVCVDPLVLGYGDGAPMKLFLKWRSMKSANTWLIS